MSNLRVAHLKLRAGQDAHFGAQLRLERALAQASIPDHKLFAVRRLTGLTYHQPSHARAGPEAEMRLSRQFSDRLVPILAGAVHGTHSGAGAANSIYFNDLTEARATYLALLARGGRASAWFWRSVLGSAWLDPTPAMAVECQFNRVLVSGQEAGEIASAFARASAAVGLAPMARLIRSVGTEAAHSSGSVPTGTGRLLASSEQPSRGTDAPVGPAIGHTPLVDRLSAHADLKAMAAALSAGQTSDPQLLVIAIRLAILGSRPDMLEFSHAQGSLVAAIYRRLADRTPLPNRPAASTRANHISATPTAANPDRELPRIAKNPANLPGTKHFSPPEEMEAEGCTGARMVDPEPSPPDSRHIFTAPVSGAGLLLIVPSLNRLNFPLWLARHDGLRQADFPRRFLLGLAARYQPRGVDAFTAMLGLDAVSPAGPPTRQWHAAETAWRIGLDRWLRRTARLRLHDLGRITGELALENEIWRCRFPLGAIQMGLRRHALDIDPGWTPWLGLSLRYEYVARPDQQEHLA